MQKEEQKLKEEEKKSASIAAGLGALGGKPTTIEDALIDRDKNIKKSYVSEFVDSNKSTLFKDPKNLEYVRQAKDPNDRKTRINKVINEAFLSSDYYKNMQSELEFANKPASERQKIVDDKMRGEISERVSSFDTDLQRKLADAYQVESQQKKDEYNDLPLLAKIGEARRTSVPFEGTPETGNYSAAKTYLDDTKKLIREFEKKDESKWKAAGRGAKDTLFDPGTWSFGVSEADKNNRISQAAEKFEKGEELSDSEQALLDALAINLAANSYYQNGNRGYQWGQISAGSIPFMLEFIANPVSGSGKGLAKSIAKYGIKKFGANGAGKVATKAGARVIGDLAAATGMTLTTGAANTAANALERIEGTPTFDIDETGKITYSGHEECEGVVPSVLKALGSNIIEYQSEMIGNAGVGSLAKQVLPGKGIAKSVKASGFGKFIGKHSNSDIVKSLRGLEKRAQWSGVLGEYGEEAYNTAMNALVIGDQKLSDLTDIDKQVDTFMGLALMGGGMSGINTIGYSTDRVKTGIKLRGVDKAASNMFENWDQLKLQLGEASVEDRADVVKNVLQRRDISIPAKNALTDYIATLTYKDSLTSSADEIRKQNRTQAQETGSKLYETIQDKSSNAIRSLSIEKQSLEAKLGGLVNLSVQEIEESPEATPELLSAALEYEIVKNEYETIQNRLKQEVDDYIAPQIKAIDEVAREDGTIVEINLGDDKLNPDIWYVLKGNVVVNEDGQVDRGASDNILYAVKNGKKKQIPASRIQFAKIDNAEETKAAIKELAYAKYVTPLEDKENGIRHFDVGEQVEFYNDKGETVAGTVGAKQGETVTVVTNDGKKTLSYTEQDLQNRIISPSLGEYHVRDQFDVMIDGNIYTADITDITDGKATLHIPNAPEAAQRFMDVNLPQLNAIRSPLMAPQEVDITSEKEVKNEDVPGAEQNNLQPELENEQQNDISAEMQAPVEEGVENAAVTPSSFIEQVPKGEKGALLFEQAPVETTVGALGEVYDDAEELNQVVDATISNIQKQIERSKSPKPTGDISKDIANKQAAKQQVLNLTAKLDYWNGVKTALTPEASSYEDRMASIEEGKMKERDVNMGEYLSLRDFLLRKIATGEFKFLWNSDGVRKGLKDEILASKNTEPERRKRISFLNNKGYTPESLAEELYENAGQGSEINPGWFNDMQEIRNEIIDILLSHDTPSSMMNAATNLRRAPETEEEYLDSFVAPELVEEYEKEREEEKESIKVDYELPFEALNDEEVSAYFDDIEEKIINFEEKKNGQGTRTETDRPDATVNRESTVTGREGGNSAIIQAQGEDNGEITGETEISEERSAPLGLEQSVEGKQGNESGRPVEEEEGSTGKNARIVDYSEKAIAVYGDTRQFKDELKALGGRFNPKLKDGPGWVFPKAKKEAVLSIVGKKENANFVENETDETEISDRSPQEEQRSGDEISGRTEETYRELGQDRGDNVGRREALERLFGGRSAIEQTLLQACDAARSERAADAAGQSSQSKERLLRELRTSAEKLGTWIDNPSNLVSDVIGRGQEHEVYLSKDGVTVIKINNFSFVPENATDFNTFLIRVLTQNKLFPTENFTILGFSINSKGEIGVVMQQPYVKAVREATDVEIDTFLEEHGFTVDMQDVWFDGRYEIIDLKTSNVLVDEDGKLRFIDVVAKDTKIEEIFKSAAVNEEIQQEAAKVDQNPTEGQKEAGNYKKGHINIQGFDITIENPAGSVRSGVDASGKEWSIEMKNHYGYFKRTEGKDGDQVDVFIGANPESKRVFVVDQVDQETRAFDESKVMLGFDSAEEARAAYLSNYEEGWQGLGAITETSVENFKEWLYDGKKQRKSFNEYKSVQATYGISNKLITPEQYEELRKRMRGKLGNLNVGFDPEILTIGAQLAMYHIEAGARKFADFAKRMIDDFGEEVRPYLRSFYEGARFMPGMEELSNEMDSAQAIRKFDIGIFGKETKKPPKKAENQKQLSIFEDDKNNNDHAGILQGNSKRLPEGQPSEVLQGTGEIERTGRGNNRQGGEVSQANGAEQRPADGERSVLPGNADVLSEQPALVRFEPESNDTAPFNKTKKYADNISAIETLLSILKEKRKATPEEKTILSKYVGFGGLKEVLLDPENDSTWKKGEDKYREGVRRIIELAKEFDEVAGTSDTLNKIRGSILNAHYTSQTVIESIYKGLHKLGFKGGLILEPSAGIGNFITYMPASIKGKSKISAVELDNLTGNILKAIHDDAHVQISGIETANIAPGSQDLVISNIPFGNYKVYDRAFKGEKEPLQNRIHNYFFAKALDQAREGGLIAFVTSKGVLDSPGNANIREYLNKNAEFLGAVRLPDTTFKNTANTEVVTDVIFLRKTSSPANPDFVSVAEVEAKHKDGAVEKVNVNRYFVDNPQNMLGEIEAGGLYDRSDYTLKDNGSFKDLSDVIRGALPANVYTKSSSAMGLQANDLTGQFENVKEGNIAYSDGQLYRKEEGVATEIKINEPETKIKDYISLRNALMDLIYSEYANFAPETIAENRRRLNEEYDKFTSLYGKLEKSIQKIAKQDADGYNVLSLELNEGKADIFTKRTINPVSTKTHAESIDEAIIISLSETAGIDLERIAQLMGMTLDEVKADSKGKIFESPEGGYVARDEYLSGNVKKKLAEAKQAVESGFTEFQHNVEELERVIPTDIPAIQIEARLGSRWIPASVYTQFAREILKDDNLRVSYSPVADQYFINDRSRTVEATHKYGTSHVNGADIILSALHINPPKVYNYYKEDGKQKRELNKEETDKAVQKYQEVRDVFEDWVYKAPDRRELLSGIYNEKLVLLN